MKDRIRLIRKKANLTQEEFATKINLTKNYISLVENGSRTMADRTIADICRTFKVNYQWLINGVGEMYKDDDGDAQAIIDSVLQGENEFARKTLLAFAKMSEEQWELIRNLVKEIESS